jgi:hypothetical protein
MPIDAAEDSWTERSWVLNSEVMSNQDVGMKLNCDKKNLPYQMAG